MINSSLSPHDVFDFKSKATTTTTIGELKHEENMRTA
jgi:hypothetical protein